MAQSIDISNIAPGNFFVLTETNVNTNQFTSDKGRMQLLCHRSKKEEKRYSIDAVVRYDQEGLLGGAKLSQREETPTAMNLPIEDNETILQQPIAGRNYIVENADATDEDIVKTFLEPVLKMNKKMNLGDVAQWQFYLLQTRARENNLGEKLMDQLDLLSEQDSKDKRGSGEKLKG